MLSQKLALAAAGNAADPLYVEDVFSTHVYVGSGSTLTINNGIDLSGEGGMVWLARRTISAGDQMLRTVDTERGGSKYVTTYLTDAEGSDSSLITSFNNNGFSLGNTYANQADNLVAWTFRKCPGFFDIVTYTGDANNGRTISHNLGSVPGSIWVKRLDGADNWTVYHRGTDSTAPEDYALFLNSTTSRSNQDLFADTAPTASVFSVGDNVKVNGNGNTYVAYLFAHDNQSFGDGGDEAVIKCGSFNSTGSVVDINLGFEPQWILIKRADASNSWIVVDSMRGNPVGSAAKYLEPNASAAESTITGWTVPTPTGFTNNYPISGGTFIYIAIRRPHKPPSAGTEVLAQKLIAGSTTTQTVSVSGAGVTDMTIIKNCTSASHAWITASRLLGNGETKMNVTNAESTATFGTSVNLWDQMSGTKLRYDIDINRNGYFYMHWQFTRKPGVFDVATYTGTGSNRTVSHNLGVTPELMIVKRRDSTGAWRVYSSVTGAGKYLRVDSNAAEATTSTRWNNTAPTSTAFTVGTASDVNASGGTYFNFLFATLAGVSKVGSYTGTGNDINVNCGFTAGARFVMIKRTDSSGDWFVFDTERGINSGNDSYLIINSEANPVTDQDYIDPLNAGFTITSSAPADLNASGGTYLFLAIA